jgi:hypothetical protein
VTPAPFDPDVLARQTYLTVAEATIYLRFGSRMALYHWIARTRIPRCRRGRTLLFLRRDLDDAVQGNSRAHVVPEHRASLRRAV